MTTHAAHFTRIAVVLLCVTRCGSCRARVEAGQVARTAMHRTLAALTATLFAAAAHAAPSVYPTGTTIYDPAKAWSGYTVFVLPETGAVLIDMNGNELKRWDQFAGLGGGPVRVLPGGQVVGAVGALQPHQESIAVAQFDWENQRCGSSTTRSGSKPKTARRSGPRASITIGNARISRRATTRRNSRRAARPCAR